MLTFSKEANVERRTLSGPWHFEQDSLSCSIMVWPRFDELALRTNERDDCRMQLQGLRTLAKNLQEPSNLGNSF